MFRIDRALLGSACLFLASCGTYVPDIQEFWGTTDDATYKVNKIAGQVVCELRRAVQRVVREPGPKLVQTPGGPAPPPPRDLSWFINKWSVQVTLNLNIIESSTLAPGVALNSIYPSGVTTFRGAPSVTTPQSFSLGLGGTASSTATRNDKLNMFFMVKELLNGTPSIGMSCLPPPTNADLFLESDLKIYDWLHAALLPYDVSIINYANNTTAQNAITHDIKFEIVSNGNVNPQWKLVRFSGNTSNALLAANRDRTQELIITFGPTQKGMLATAAANSHLATETGAAVSQAIQSLPSR
ncbi:hypothetical protein [Bradyrhizobium sp. OK095]|uniref:hypothetical protein n=1 Tax=Bradyrhizobium sp. OK095 TaxID=1882760 RepID=UPI0008BE2B9C|nr:hypothetical protein [Bradyrhizobium sp. OK095]SEM54789.1 hypothetical protein SAMN05443254_102567 [Bradyrhizobium sp. OK095]